MTLYRKLLGQFQGRPIYLTLTALGAASKPFYFCQVRQLEECGIDSREPVSLFLEQHPEPTESVEAAVGFARGFASLFCRLPADEAWESVKAVGAACKWIGPDGCADWKRIRNVALELELNVPMSDMTRNPKL